MPRPTTDPQNRFVEWLKDELPRKKLTRQLLCDLTGIDSGQMSRITSRDVKLSFENAMLMAPYLGLDAIAMQVRAELIDPPPALTIPEVRLLQAHRNLNEEGQDVLAILGEALQEKYPARPSKRGDRTK